MKKVIVSLVTLLIINCTMNIENCNCQWINLGGVMSNESVMSLGVMGSYVFAGTVFDGVFYTSNNGTSWTQSVLNNKTVWSFTVNGNRLFAGTAGSGVYYSTNNGTGWTQTSLNSQTTWALAVDGNYLIAGTGNGIYLSTNNGTNWSQPGFTQNVNSLLVSGGVVYIGTTADGVWKTSNDFLTWGKIGVFSEDVHSLALNGNYLFAATHNNGVYVTSNNGANWVQTPLSNQLVYTLAQNGNKVFAGTDLNGVYATTNNGLNWVQYNVGLNDLSIRAFCVLSNYIYAGTWNCVYKRLLSTFTSTKQISSQVPAHYALEQNFPNPFNPTTNIRYALPNNGFVNIVVYDELGREIKTLVNENQTAGTYEANFDASNLTSGIYFYKLSSGDFTETKRMLMIK